MLFSWVKYHDWQCQLNQVLLVGNLQGSLLGKQPWLARMYISVHCVHECVLVYMGVHVHGCSCVCI